MLASCLGGGPNRAPDWRDVYAARMSDMSQQREDELVERPGEALDSGFRFQPARTAREGRLSPEARRRVIEKMDSVDEARLRAARDGQTAYIG